MSKKKILLLSDDFRLPSGIGTISKEIILKTVHHYDWVQIGAAVNHPEQGKFLDISKQVADESGVEDASVKLIPWTGYGDRNILFQIIEHEKPDAIFHFTDPRYWIWLYQLEHEIKVKYKLPIVYYSIWDDLPYPMWNAPYYASSDLIMGISKQSHNIHNEVLRQNNYPVIDLDTQGREPDQVDSWDTVYTAFVPHGLDETKFKPLSETDAAYQSAFKRIKTDNDIDFAVLWNNRNIRRKQPGDVILAFETFRKQLPEAEQDRVGLVLHTTPIDNNGTDLRAVHQAIAPDAKVIFSETKLSTEDMNAMYNVCDVTLNIGSNEGWGLSSTESILAGTPIINNVTGGLQDQCGFVDKNGEPIRFTSDIPSNHTGVYLKHGEWAKPVFPSNRSIQGSPQTPYIFDDRVSTDDVAAAIRYWYDTPVQLKQSKGLVGREWALENGLTAQQMANTMIKHIDFLLSRTKQARPSYTLSKVSPNKFENIGII